MLVCVLSYVTQSDTLIASPNLQNRLSRPKKPISHRIAMSWNREPETLPKTYYNKDSESVSTTTRKSLYIIMCVN